MTYFDIAENLEKIKCLAAHNQTGTPLQLATKLQVSERTIQRMVQQLRDHSIPIHYNRFRNTYVLAD
jgi:predicted DNA-binding transcriptional regulator YafY